MLTWLLLVMLMQLSWILLLAAVIVAMMRTRAAERRHPPIGEFLEVRSIRVHYLARGPAEAPALVLLHGNGAAIHRPAHHPQGLAAHLRPAAGA